MNGMRRWTAFVLAGLAFSPLLADTVEVLSDRVILRAKPRAEAEVVGQVGKGTVLPFRGTNLEWVAVTPPTNVGVWVSSEFIKDNVVGTDKLNVRAGAGISYPVVGTLVKNDSVTPRSQLGQWMEIVPPSNATVWVHRDYVRTAVDKPETPSAPPAMAPVAPVEQPALALDIPVAPAIPQIVTKEEPAAPPPELKESDLVPLPAQSEVMEFEGGLRKTSFFDFSKVSNYCLVSWDRGRPSTVCYIRGNNAQLKTFEGRRLRIKGDGYWVKDCAKPVLVPRQITPLVEKAD